jgi:branched-chain amino acid transport system permease protein
MKKLDLRTLSFIIGSVLLFTVVQVVISLGVLNDFWSTIIRLAGVMAIVSIGLNLIYGINGQFSLGQFGFYAIGAYSAADITYRWTQLNSGLGLSVLFTVASLIGLAIFLVMQFLKNIKGIDALSSFTLYLTAVIHYWIHRSQQCLNPSLRKSV